MFSAESKIRVRYSEVDIMGYVYYGNYGSFYEVGRVDAMRQIGISYKDLEANGYMMPVVEMFTKYFKPAHYDDFVTVKTFVKEMPSVRMKFYYELYNEENVLLNTGYTIHVFVSHETRKPCQPPEVIISGIKQYFTTDN